MNLGLVNLVMLFGLFAVAIPIIIHLLNRQRYQVVDWGAMQFLQIGTTRRRKLFLEELLLMLLRMGLIGLLVLALTAPYAAGPLTAQFASRPSRDVVLIFDCSASMGRDDGYNVTPHEAAKKWAQRFLSELSPGDTITVVLARHQPVPLTDNFTRDLAAVGELIVRLPPPRGSCNGARAVQFSLDLLKQHGQNTEKDIMILTDGQRSGWFDAASLSQWKKIGKELQMASRSQTEFGNEGHGLPEPAGGTPALQPRLWLVTVPDQSKAGQSFPNFYLSPMRFIYAHGWLSQPMRFVTNLQWKGPLPLMAPDKAKLQLLIDGKLVRELKDDHAWHSDQMPVSFEHSFTTTGSHLLSVVFRPNPPGLDSQKDFLATDNRCDLAVMVRDKLHVLLVDGDEEITFESSTSSLRKAFNVQSGTSHPSAVAATAVSYKNFTPELLTANAKGGKPRVLVLADVPSLDEKQRPAVEKFLEEGGSVLVAVGERITEPALYNLDLYQGGNGWLPAQLEKKEGNRTQPEKAVAVDMGELQPPLGIFREKPKSGLAQARFPQWWKVSRPNKSAGGVVALLSNGDPLLVEKPYGKGRVVLCTVPLDHSWGSTLPTFAEYPVLVHELIYFLANTKSIEYNVAPGQPLRFDPEDLPDGTAAISLPVTAELQRPDGTKEHIQVKSWPLLYDNTEEPGIYQLHLAGAKSIYYVVDADRQESDLTLATEEERQALQENVPVRYEDDPHQIGLAVIGPEHREDIWWILMLGVISLLCLEILWTRRMVAKREA